MGEVQDRYLGFTEGGDQLCGRVACGLDIGSSSFAVLPPAFCCANVLTEEEWQLVAPGYENFPTPFKSMMPMLLASLVCFTTMSLSIKEMTITI